MDKLRIGLRLAWKVYMTLLFHLLLFLIVGGVITAITGLVGQKCVDKLKRPSGASAIGLYALLAVLNFIVVSVLSGYAVVSFVEKLVN